MKHILPTDLINKILTYLSSKAYSEVALLIDEIKTKAEAYFDKIDPPVPPAPPVNPAT